MAYGIHAPGFRLQATAWLRLCCVRKGGGPRPELWPVAVAAKAVCVVYTCYMHVVVQIPRQLYVP